MKPEDVIDTEDVQGDAHPIEVIEPDDFDPDRHFYSRAQNAQIHPLVLSFFRMSLPRLVSRYCHLHPQTDRNVLESILTTPPRYLLWSGSDIFNVSTETGVRQKLIVETNSCPSGQKSFPLLEEHLEEGGYYRLIEKTFLPLVAREIKKAESQGIVAVLYDKNRTEATGYASVLATLIRRPVHLIPCMQSDPRRYLEVDDRNLFARVNGHLVPVICAFRYVTQKPWTRLPFNLKTPVLNPIVACLAGGRNKTSAAKAYEVFNASHRETGLEILTPESFTNVRKAEIPLLVDRLGGKAVVKVPYLNAGQGIFTIVNPEELDSFMAQDFNYDEFIVQQLVGSYKWSSASSRGKVYNIGTVPDKKDRIYAFDLRMMVSWQVAAYAPVSLYARRAQLPMTAEEGGPGENSWLVLGTNLSRKVSDDHWDTEPKRLLMMDRKDFSKLGLGLDDLIEAFVQAVMANRAIDDMARRLVKRGGNLRKDLFLSISNDPALLEEIVLA